MKIFFRLMAFAKNYKGWIAVAAVSILGYEHQTPVITRWNLSLSA